MTAGSLASGSARLDAISPPPRPRCPGPARYPPAPRLAAAARLGSPPPGPARCPGSRLPARRPDPCSTHEHFRPIGGDNAGNRPPRRHPGAWPAAHRGRQDHLLITAPAMGCFPAPPPVLGPVDAQQMFMARTSGSGRPRSGSRRQRGGGAAAAWGWQRRRVPKRRQPAACAPRADEGPASGDAGEGGFGRMEDSVVCVARATAGQIDRKLLRSRRSSSVGRESTPHRSAARSSAATAATMRPRIARPSIEVLHRLSANPCRSIWYSALGQVELYLD